MTIIATKSYKVPKVLLFLLYGKYDIERTVTKTSIVCTFNNRAIYATLHMTGQEFKSVLDYIHDGGYGIVTKLATGYTQVELPLPTPQKLDVRRQRRPE